MKEKPTENEKKVAHDVDLLFKRIAKAFSSILLKVFSLCFLASGKYYRKKCNSPLEIGKVLSIIPCEMSIEDKKLDEILDKFFQLSFPFTNCDHRTKMLCSFLILMGFKCRILMHFNWKILKLNESKPAKRKSSSQRVSKRIKGPSTSHHFDEVNEDNCFILPYAYASDCCSMWLEVQIGKKWSPIDPFDGKITSFDEIGLKLSAPLEKLKETKIEISYVIAFDGNGHFLDVTVRYAAKRLYTSVRKARGDEEYQQWWLNVSDF